MLESDKLEESISHVDIVYSTRIQEERFSSQEEADLYRGRFRLNQSIYTHHCEPNTVIMHPLPRDSRENARELDDDLNDNPNLAIFRQADNGLLVRMALFTRRSILAWSSAIGSRACSVLRILPVRTAASSPLPGHMHVSSFATGGFSGRPMTFVLGLDQGVFPGAGLQGYYHQPGPFQ